MASSRGILNIQSLNVTSLRPRTVVVQLLWGRPARLELDVATRTVPRVALGLRRFVYFILLTYLRHGLRPELHRSPVLSTHLCDVTLQSIEQSPLFSKRWGSRDQRLSSKRPSRPKKWPKLSTPRWAPAHDPHALPSPSKTRLKQTLSMRIARALSKKRKHHARADR